MIRHDSAWLALDFSARSLLASLREYANASGVVVLDVGERVDGGICRVVGAKGHERRRVRDDLIALLEAGHLSTTAEGLALAVGDRNLRKSANAIRCARWRARRHVGDTLDPCREHVATRVSEHVETVSRDTVRRDPSGALARAAVTSGGLGGGSLLFDREITQKDQDQEGENDPSLHPRARTAGEARSERPGDRPGVSPTRAPRAALKGGIR